MASARRWPARCSVAERVGAVGIIVNPWAGKDLRRMHAPAGHTPDTAKVGIVRRAAIAAVESGASRVVLARDVARIAERAAKGLDRVELLDGPATGSALDTRRAAAELQRLGCSPLVVLGGDGTCRDVAIGTSAVTLIAISTGTNNVFPAHLDATSAGCAAGLLAAGLVTADQVATPAKVLHVTVGGPQRADQHHLALVDVAVLDGTHVGARAVLRPAGITAVVAAIAAADSTGLSSIAGRIRPIRRDHPGAVAVTLGGSRRVRVPIVPGAFETLHVDTVTDIAEGHAVVVAGPAVVAFDGERDVVVGAHETISITVGRDGPLVVDVAMTLRLAAERQLFDVPYAPPDPLPATEARHAR